MRDEMTDGVESAEQSGLSRRNALKAGVAVGVGAAACGLACRSHLLAAHLPTPRGCTGAKTFSIHPCDNTDSASFTQFRYQHFQNTADPDFFLNVVPGVTPCESSRPSTCIHLSGWLPSAGSSRFFNAGKDTCKVYPAKGVDFNHAIPGPIAEQPARDVRRSTSTSTATNLRSPAHRLYSVDVQCKTIGSPAECVQLPD